MWGSNFAESNPLGWPVLKTLVAAGKIKLIVIDPRRTKSAEIADQHLALRPRTDGPSPSG
jgi:anaerobic selenocysteine-containing dehydrogenase